MMPGNPVVGGSVLRRPAIQSPNYVAGVSGWSVNADGTAEFNSVTVRGTVTSTDGSGDSVSLSSGHISFQPAGAFQPGTITAVPGLLLLDSGAAVSGFDPHAQIALLDESTSGAGVPVIQLSANQSQLNTSATAPNVPVSSAGITTVAQLITALKAAGVLS